MATVCIDTLRRYKDAKKLRCASHPTLPLLIWNYSEVCQYQNDWDEVTLRARALITDTTGNIVARAFDKFFNLSQGRHTPTDEWTLYEKMDGSLGVLFHYAGQWRFASRGSFTSEQAAKATDMLHASHRTDGLETSRSYIFEILYPANRVVVDYGPAEKLVYLATFDVATGAESFDAELVRTLGFDVVQTLPDCDYLTYASRNLGNREGAVVRFSNGSRAKIKFADYLALHRVVTNLNDRSVWEMYLADPCLDAHLDNIPDEVHPWFTQLWGRFATEENRLTEDVHRTVEAARHHLPNRKAFAQAVKHHTHSALAFMLADGRDIRPRLCATFKPSFAGTDRDTRPYAQPGPKLIVLCGISCSGKTTWAREYVDTHKRSIMVSRDALRMLYWGHNDVTYYRHPALHSREQHVTEAQTELIRHAVQAGRTVVVDNTHLRAKYIRAYQSALPDIDVEYKLFEVDTDTAIARDAARDRRVGAAHISAQARKLELLKTVCDFAPQSAADFKAVPASDPALPHAYVFDVDGTLALNTSGRSYYDWSRVGEDAVVEPVAACARALHARCKILVCSGRSEVCRDETLQWLARHRIPCDRLSMRPAGDVRVDATVKEALWRALAAEFNIQAMFDDRQPVVAHARRLGFRVFQVEAIPERA